jgi:hypothetical protein
MIGFFDNTLLNITDMTVRNVKGSEIDSAYKTIRLSLAEGATAVFSQLNITNNRINYNGVLHSYYPLGSLTIK